MTGMLNFSPSVSTTSGVVDIKMPSSGAMSALRLVVINASGQFEYADPSTYEDSLVVGLLLDASTGSGIELKARTSGLVEDAFFTFPINDNLYLTDNGVVTNVPETTGHSILIGKSEGTGKIRIKIEEPIILT